MSRRRRRHRLLLSATVAERPLPPVLPSILRRNPPRGVCVLCRNLWPGVVDARPSPSPSPCPRRAESAPSTVAQKKNKKNNDDHDRGHGRRAARPQPPGPLLRPRTTRERWFSRNSRASPLDRWRDLLVPRVNRKIMCGWASVWVCVYVCTCGGTRPTVIIVTPFRLPRYNIAALVVVVV